MDADTRNRKAEREMPAHVQAAIDALGATPAKLLDTAEYAYFGTYAINPVKVELLLASRGRDIRPGESIRDALARHYGERTARLLDAAL